MNSAVAADADGLLDRVATEVERLAGRKGAPPWLASVIDAAKSLGTFDIWRLCRLTGIQRGKLADALMELQRLEMISTVAFGEYAWTGLESEAAGWVENELARAGRFLVEALGQGPRPSHEVIRAAQLAGISERTLRRAKARIGGRSLKTVFDGGWTWALPSNAVAASGSPADQSGTPAAASTEQTG